MPSVVGGNPDVVGCSGALTHIIAQKRTELHRGSTTIHYSPTHIRHFVVFQDSLFIWLLGNLKIFARDMVYQLNNGGINHYHVKILDP